MAAVSSRPGGVTELTTWNVPNSDAAFAAPAAASGWKVCIDPNGASMTGIRSFVPRNVVVASMLETSISPRGRKASRSNASRLRRIVVSDSDPARGVVPRPLRQVAPRHLDDLFVADQVVNQVSPLCGDVAHGPVRRLRGQGTPCPAVCERSRVGVYPHGMAWSLEP